MMGLIGIHGFQQLILNPSTKPILRNSINNLKLKIHREHLRNLTTSNITKAKSLYKYQLENNPSILDNLPEIIRYKNDSRIIFSSFIEDHTVNKPYLKRRRLEEKIKNENKVKRRDESIPLIVEMLKNADNIDTNIIEAENLELKKIHPNHFPYAHYESVNFVNKTEEKNTHESDNWNVKSLSVVEDVALRMQMYEEGNLDYKENKKQQDDITYTEEKWNKHRTIYNNNQGSFDPSIPSSKVPCGGCGAILHCQDAGLPGFLPKERFVGLDKGELRSIKCQRCYFLRNFKMALNVRVSPDFYPKLLEPIRNERALVVVVVDVMDVPCSIWPGLLSIIGTKRPVIIVGNKTDLLPSDGPHHLDRVLASLTTAVENTDLGRANIKHITLASAINGYGIESLISRIHKSWGISGDIYIIGCTNTGKSTLFNALLGSDMCRIEATDLVQRATTSPWPGTTLNMLKFPLLRPSGERLFIRVKRLQEQQAKSHLETKLKPKYTKNIKLATLSGYIGSTFKREEEPEETSDPFSIPANRIPIGSRKILGINSDHPRYSKSKWCYDTPGTVQPDQLLNLLSHEELMQVLPRHLLIPRSFYMNVGHSLFIAGLARLDLLYSTDIVRFTLFCSSELPICVVPTVEASSFYRSYLGTELLGVPMGNAARLKQWPHLQPRNLTTTGVGSNSSAADVVLSSAGFIALQGEMEAPIDVRGWTPGGRGIYLRDPPMLPYAISTRGKLKRGSIAYEPHRLLVPNKRSQYNPKNL